MKLQFLLCENPNKREQGTYIYHADFPRFLAKVEEDDSLKLVDAIDQEADTPRVQGKLKRAAKWFLSTKADMVCTK